MEELLDAAAKAEIKTENQQLDLSHGNRKKNYVHLFSAQARYYIGD